MKDVNIQWTVTVTDFFLKVYSFSKQILIIFCSNKGVNASVTAIAEWDGCDMLQSPHNGPAHLQHKGANLKGWFTMLAHICEACPPNVGISLGSTKIVHVTPQGAAMITNLICSFDIFLLYSPLYTFTHPCIPHMPILCRYKVKYWLLEKVWNQEQEVSRPLTVLTYAGTPPPFPNAWGTVSQLQGHSCSRACGELAPYCALPPPLLPSLPSPPTHSAPERP